MWCGIYTRLCYKFPTESNSERILKIGQYLVKLWARVIRCLVFFLTHSVLTSSLGIDSADCCRISVAVFIFSLILCVFFFVRLIKLAIGHFSEHTNTAYRIVSRQTNSRFVSSDHSIDATRSIDRRPPESSCTSPHLSIRHGTGSLGHRVNGSFESSFTSGSPGHHFDPVRDPSFSGFRKNAQNAKRTFEMPK